MLTLLGAKDWLGEHESDYLHFTYVRSRPHKAKGAEKKAAEVQPAKQKRQAA